MSSFKKILYVIYTLMFVFTVVAALYNESLLATFELNTMYNFWMIWALIGFVLLMFESVLENIHQASINRNKNRLAKENNELKARMYDEMTRAKRDEHTIIRNQENNPKPPLQSF